MTKQHRVKNIEITT